MPSNLNAFLVYAKLVLPKRKTLISSLTLQSNNRAESPASKASYIVRNACVVMDQKDKNDKNLPEVPMKLLPYFQFLNSSAQR